MGVVCVINYQIPDGKVGQQGVDMLLKRVEDLGAAKTGQYQVDCETYQSIQQAAGIQRTVNIMHNSEHPASCFAVLDTNTCLVADFLFSQMMLKLKSCYASKKGMRVECKGQRFELGDFLIKIGSVAVGQNMSFKGILVEVEYLPCVVGSDYWNLMLEFIQGFLGNQAENGTNWFKQKMDSPFTASDTIQQYLEHFNNFRGLSTAQQLSQNQLQPNR